MKKSLSILLILTLIFSSFSVVTAQKNNLVNNSNNYTGEEIFVGAVLGQGKLAESLRELWSTEQYEHNNSDDVLNITQPVIEIMKKEEPQYFKQLENVVKKGNHVQTQKLLDKGSEWFLEVYSNQYGETFNSEEVGTNGVVAYFALAVGLVIVYSHAVGLTFYLYAAAVGPGISSNSSDFEKEQLIYQLIEEVN